MIFKILLNIFILVLIISITKLIIKSHSRILEKILKIIAILLTAWIIFFSTDYILVKNQKLPLFCYKIFGLISYQDGGTVEYIGFGYKVIDFHKLVYQYSGWGNTFKFEYKYICPWYINYNDAFNKIEENHLKAINH